MNGLLHHLALTLKLNFRSKQAIIYGYVVPIFFLFALGSVFSSNAKTGLQGDMGRLLTITILGGACFGMPTAMVAERERGVWRRYRLLPTATGGIILSAMMARFVIVLSAVIMQIVLARIFYKTPFPEHPFLMFIAFAFVCLAFLGLGLVIAMVSDSVPAVQALGQAIFLPLIIIGGVGVKLETLPHWAEHVARFLPGIYAVEALQVTQHGSGHFTGNVSFDYLALTVIGVAALIAGSKMFRWDAGQKLPPSARGWVAVAVLAWAALGTADEIGNRMQHAARARDIALKESQSSHSSEASSKSGTERMSQSNPPATSATTQSAESAIATTTAHSTTPAVAVTPTEPPKAAKWENITPAQSALITYDDLPDDNSTTTPLAPDLAGLDDDSKKRMDDFSDALADWPPAKVQDIPQRIRNLLSICAVADVAEDPNEAQIPYVVFTYLKGTIPKQQLIKALTWVIMNDREGTVFTNVKDIKELSIDAEIGEDNVRDRSTLYAKKLLFRLLGKKLAN